MTKKEYLKKLEGGLSGIPESDVKDIMADYEEHFSIGESEGRSEQELIESLGEPGTLGKQIKADYRIKKAEKNFSANNIVRAVFATAGLGFLNLVFVLGPFLGALGMLFGLMAGGITITSIGVVLSLSSLIAAFVPVSQFTFSGMYPQAMIFFGISMASFGLLFLIGWGYLVKWFYILTVRYLKFNAKIITGERE